MKVFIYAVEREAKPLLDILKAKFEKKVGQLEIYSSNIQERHFRICLGGIGKVASSSSILLIESAIHEPIEEIINVGVAGSINPSSTTLIPLQSAILPA